MYCPRCDIDMTSDNLEDIVFTIADRYNIDSGYIKDLIVKKVIGYNIDESKNNLLSSRINSSIESNLSPRYSTMTLEKKTYRKISII
jgi:hypothetical protein